jgi:hypothetical protein
LASALHMSAFGCPGITKIARTLGIDASIVQRNPQRVMSVMLSGLRDVAWLWRNGDGGLAFGCKGRSARTWLGRNGNGGLWLAFVFFFN